MKSKFSRFVKRIRDTEIEEINCSVCLDQVSQYVDIELTKGNAAERMPQVRHHLGQCGVCFEEYQMLRELARLEQTGSTPSIDDLANQLKRPPTERADE